MPKKRASKKRKTATTRKAQAKKSRKKAATARTRGGARSRKRGAAAAAKVPAPLAGVPKDRVGGIVQDFIDFDGVLDLDVRAEPGGTFLVQPIR